MKEFQDLSLRVKNALMASGITSLEQISSMTDRDITRIQGISRKGLCEIRLAMIDAGIPIPGAYKY